MTLTFTIDQDYSYTYLEKQIENIKLLLDNVLVLRKKQEDEEEDDDCDSLRTNRPTRKNIKIVKYTEPLSLPEVNEPVAPVVEEKIKDDPKIICECGGSFIKRNKLRHDTSKTHKQFVALKNISNK
jgi:16S rRNA G527 N7-methylase RsmG